MHSSPLLKYIFVAALSIGSLTVASVSAYFFNYWCVAFNIILYTTLTFIVLKKFGYNRSMVIALISPLSILVYLHIKNFKETLFSLPPFFACIIGIITGIYFLRHHSRAAIVVYSALLFLATIWFSLFGYPLFMHKINFGTFTGTVSEPAPKFAFVDSLGHKYQMFEGVTVLDFWTTRCGICFEKFPLLEKLHNEYKNDPNIKIYAANMPTDDDTTLQAFKQIFQRNYTFAVLKSAEPIDTTLKKFNFSYVPTVIILNSQNQIKYRGDIDGVEQALKNLRYNR